MMTNPNDLWEKCSCIVWGGWEGVDIYGLLVGGGGGGGGRGVFVAV